MTLRILNVFRLWSSSLEESENNLAHFGGILDHATKIITTLGLLVALEIVRQKSDVLLVDVMFTALGIAFFIYLLRVLEHILVFYVDKFEWCPTDSNWFRLGGGVLVTAVNVCLSMYGYEMIKQLAKINFLQGAG